MHTFALSFSDAVVILPNWFLLWANAARFAGFRTYWSRICARSNASRVSV